MNPNPSAWFGSEGNDPVAAAKKSALARGDRYKFLRQTLCTTRCPYFEKGCIYISLSKSLTYHGRCAVKNLPIRQQKRVIRFLEGKNDDFISNLIELYQEIENSVKIRKDPQLMMQAFDRLQKLYILIHGGENKKQDVTDTGVDMKELFDKMGEQLKEMEQKHLEEKKKQEQEKKEETNQNKPNIKTSNVETIPLEDDYDESETF